MTRQISVLIVILLQLSLVFADDGRGLKRGADPKDVTISGVSSGAAMAVQYAVAHSASIAGVGSIAGPCWGCARGSVSQAVNECMCARQPIPPQVDLARNLAEDDSHDIDQLNAGKPKALKQAYVFQSATDAVVAEQSATANINFLGAFIGTTPTVDRGDASNGSASAGHGIVSPDGTDSCQPGSNDSTYVRRCGNEDNAGELFHALYGNGMPYDPSKRASTIPESDLWSFDQQALIDEVKAQVGTIVPDSFFWIFPVKSDRRENLDLAQTGYLYVPPSCRNTNSNCRVHVALHGCKQDARQFATTAGYNNWAEHYRVIVIYPAVDQNTQYVTETCDMNPVPQYADDWVIEPNPNGCWDWWGYLDVGWPEQYRYLTKKAPQMQVIERVIAEVTTPVQ